MGAEVTRISTMILSFDGKLMAAKFASKAMMVTKAPVEVEVEA